MRYFEVPRSGRSSRLRLGLHSSSDHRYAGALQSYTNAIETYPTAVYYSNRAFCHIRLENFGLAILDATKALELDPAFIKAYGTDFTIVPVWGN